MPTYLEAISATETRAETALSALWDRFHEGKISRPEFDATAKTLLRATSARAAGVADLALAQRIEELTGEPTSALGLDPESDEEDINTRVTSITDETAAVELGVAVRVVTRAAGQGVFDQGIKDHGVPGWRRATNGSKCPVCNGLAEATYLPSRIRMYTHPGCGCHPDPVMSDPG